MPVVAILCFDHRVTGPSIYDVAERAGVAASTVSRAFADPGRVTGARERATIAPQALYLLNHPFVQEQAAATARRLANTPEPAEQLWRLALGRAPTPGERRIAQTHLESSPDSHVALAELAHAVMGSVEFRNLR